MPDNITGSVSFKTPRAEIVVSHNSRDETMITVRTNAPTDTEYSTIVMENPHDMVVHMMVKSIDNPTLLVKDDIDEDSEELSEEE